MDVGNYKRKSLDSRIRGVGEWGSGGVGSGGVGGEKKCPLNSGGGSLGVISY
ncbi:MAG: hypothetical protein DSM106950_34755 [Stigonema ocellatum SAG 48.90 = DSM 106950]|nr:hypothetical protein [Stigonema ocellatum SAG 48.90 = DSM 106950]